MKIRENRCLNQRSGGVGRLSISPSQGDDPGFKSRPEHIINTAELGSPVLLFILVCRHITQTDMWTVISSSFCIVIIRMNWHVIKILHTTIMRSPLSITIV